MFQKFQALVSCHRNGRRLNTKNSNRICAAFDNLFISGAETWVLNQEGVHLISAEINISAGYNTTLSYV